MENNNNSGQFSSMKCSLKFNNVEFINDSKIKLENSSDKTLADDDTLHSYTLDFDTEMKEYHKKFKKELFEKFNSLKLQFSVNNETIVFTGLKQNIELIKEFYTTLVKFDINFKPFESFIIGIKKMLLNHDFDIYYDVSQESIFLFGDNETVNKIKAKIEK
jgi:hypothetical protein